MSLMFRFSSGAYDQAYEDSWSTFRTQTPSSPLLRWFQRKMLCWQLDCSVKTVWDHRGYHFAVRG
jgi:hypothetical protein